MAPAVAYWQVAGMSDGSDSPWAPQCMWGSTGKILGYDALCMSWREHLACGVVYRMSMARFDVHRHCDVCLECMFGGS